MNIMAAVDPEDPGDEVRHALAWSARLGASLHIRSVSSSPEDHHAALAALVDQIPEAMVGSARVLHGVPGRVLVDEAASMDLVVIGTHGRTGLGRVFLGSVAERVVRLAPGSVLVVPRDAEPMPMTGRFKAALPVDARDPSLAAVQRMKAWFGSDAEIHVVYGLADLFASRRVGLIDELTSPEQHPHREWAEQEIRAALQTAELEVANLHFLLTSSHHPAAELAEFCTTIDASVAAMPTHGRQGLARLQFGSVTERLVRLCSVPSVVVR